MTNTSKLDDVVRAYHLTSAEHAVGDIALRRLKVARFTEVNDPFELFALDCMKKERRLALKQFRELQNRHTGLLSFSKSWKNPVLWSHYAAGGRGIVLGFDIRRSLGTRGVLEVTYEDSKLKALATTLRHRRYQKHSRNSCLPGNFSIGVTSRKCELL